MAQPEPLNPNKKGRSEKKSERLEREKEALISQLAAERLDTVRARVAFILNHHEEARNSDRVLFLTYWWKFQPNVLGPRDTLNEDNILLLENPMSLSRARQKIQNEYGLYQAAPEVQRFRRERRIEYEETAILDKPDRPVISVYGDESGVKERYAIVGSFWSLDGRSFSQLMLRLVNFKKDRGINHEFHFNDLSKGKLQVYKDFFTEAMGMSDTFSFKAVAVDRTGMNRSTEDTFHLLYLRLILEGTRHELESGRAVPPRILSVFKDKAQTNDTLDKLALAKLSDDVTAGINQRFGNDVALESLQSVDSKSNFVIQLADLFTGSINRMLNPVGEGGKHKDELAEFILGILGLDISSDGTVRSARTDVAVLHFI